MAGPQDGSLVSQSYYMWTDLGYFQNNSLATAQTLAQLAAAAIGPSGSALPFATAGIIDVNYLGLARAAVIFVEGAAIRWIADGQTPTATYGNEVSSGTAFMFQGDMTKLKMIQVSGGAIVNVNLLR